MENIRVIANKEDIVAIANGIRALHGTSDAMSLDTMKTTLSNIKVVLPDLTNEAEAFELLLGMELIDQNGNIVTGTMPNNGSIVSTMDGINEKTFTIPAGYTSGGSVSLDDTIDNEIIGQENLITQIRDVVNSLPNAGGELALQSNITITPTKSTQTIMPDASYNGFKKVTVEPIPNEYIIPNGTKTITENGTYDIAQYASAQVNIADSGGSSDVEISLLTREITSYSNSTLTKLGAYALSGTNITSLSLPSLTTIAGYAFYECTKLTNVTFPLLTEIPYNGFRQCKGLVKADLPALTAINENGMYQCSALETLILRSNSVCTLTGSASLAATKIANGTGYVYVPRALIDTYKTATNWSKYASQFRAIEDYPEILW